LLVIIHGRLKRKKYLGIVENIGQKEVKESPQLVKVVL